MKYIIALLLSVAFGSVAHAESCRPAGMEYMHAFESRPNWVVWWWCDSTHFQWAPIIPADTTTEKIVAYHAFALGLNPGWFSAPSEYPADDPLMVNMQAAVAAFAAADTHRPPAPPAAAWFVAKNGTYSDRPTYPAINGVRSTKSDGRVGVGAPCDCKTPIVEGKTTYCPRAVGGAAPPASASTSVAVCVKQ